MQSPVLDTVVGGLNMDLQGASDEWGDETGLLVT